MKLLKDIKSSMNFEDRYSDMAGSKGGYNRKEKKALKQAGKAGVTLNENQEDRSDYLNTVGAEKTRAITTGVTAAVGTGVGLYTGNPAMVKSSLAMGANYVGGEMAEDAAGNDGVGQQLGVQDALSTFGPLAATLGQGSGGGDALEALEAPEAPETPETPQINNLGDIYTESSDPKITYKAGGSLRYNPRKYDYIKGNTFGL